MTSISDHLYECISHRKHADAVRVERHRRRMAAVRRVAIVGMLSAVAVVLILFVRR